MKCKVLDRNVKNLIEETSLLILFECMIRDVGLTPKYAIAILTQAIQLYMYTLKPFLDCPYLLDVIVNTNELIST